MDNNTPRQNENNNLNQNQNRQMVMVQQPQQQQNSITLGDIVRVVKKNWLLIAIITVVIFIGGLVYTLGIKKPTYKSTATLKVEIPLTTETSSDVGNSVTAALRYVQSVADLAKFDSVLKPVSDNAENEITLSKLRSEVSTSYSTTSIFITVSVEDQDAKKAIKLAKAVSEEIAKYSKEAVDGGIAETSRLLCTISISDPATRASYASPNKTLYLIVSGLGGLVLALIVVFLKEFASTKFKTPDEIESLGLPIINTLPDDKVKGKTSDDDTLISPSVKNFEPYNRLISNVKYANVDNPYKVIMFTSSIMDELKTTTAANFAYTLSHNEKKVVVLDLDTRKPTIHKVFGVPKENGLVEYLDGSLEYENLVKHTDINVDVVTVGKKVANPITLLESAKLKELIEKLAQDYEYVVVDTPPLMACNDATIISKLCDGVIFNVAINQGKKKEVKSSITQLLENDANVIGINITKANVRDRGGYYYYYYYDYGDNK